jgi:hypothetical protein
MIEIRPFGYPLLQMITHRKKNKLGRIQVPDTAPLAHSVEDATHRLSSAVETAGARTAKSARKGAKQASDRASALSEQLGDRVNHAQLDLKHDLKRARRKRRFWQFWRRVDSEAILKAQLAKTSRDLAHESSDLNSAVNSLNSVIKANRKGAARGRTRLIAGTAIGAALMYHFDAEHGKERRKATARRLRGVAGRSSSGPSS